MFQRSNSPKGDTCAISPGLSTLNVALGAVAFGLKGHASRRMASAAGCLGCFGRFVQTRFEIQRGLGILLEQLVVARLAITIGALHVRCVIERDVAVLCGKRELFGSFLLLSKKAQSTEQGDDEETGNRSTHGEEYITVNPLLVSGSGLYMNVIEALRSE